VYDELGLLGVVFVDEVDEDFEAAASERFSVCL